MPFHRRPFRRLSVPSTRPVRKHFCQLNRQGAHSVRCRISTSKRSPTATLLRDRSTLRSVPWPDSWLSFTIASRSGTIAAAEMVGGWPVELRAGLIGAAVGTLAWFAPDLVGGGDPITQRTLAGVAETLALLPVVFLVRLALDAVLRTPQERQAGYSRPCLCLQRSSACYFRTPLPDRFSRSEYSTGRICRRRDGGLFHRRRTGRAGILRHSCLGLDIVAGKTALASSPQVWRSENVSLISPPP